MPGPRQYIYSQFGHPRGVLGKLVGAILEKRQSNRQRAQWAVDLLDLQEDDQVLEIGFGTGYSLELIAPRIPLGALVGVDHSSLMVKQASERLARHKDDIPLALITAAVEDLPNLQQPFNKVLAVNSLMFWEDKEKCLRDIKARMLPGGTIVIVQQPREPKADRETTERVGRGIQTLLKIAGFSELRSELNSDLGPVPAVAVMGRS